MVGAPPRMRVSVATHPDRQAPNRCAKRYSTGARSGSPVPDRAWSPPPEAVRRLGERPFPLPGRKSRMTRSRDSLFLNDDGGRENLRSAHRS